MKRFLLPLLLSAVVFVAHAEEIDAQAPKFNVNDSWQYTKTDNWKNVVVDQFISTVEKVEDGKVWIEVKRETGKGTKNIFTTDGNLISNGGMTVNPYVPNFKFPLSIGKTWKETYESKLKNGVTIQTTLSVSVIGIEEVAVPAGQFEAWKLESHALYNRSDTPGTGRQHSVYWYAPATKRVVLIEYDDTTPAGTPFERSTLRLEHYKLEP